MISYLFFAFVSAVSGLKILSFGHVNPRSGAPGAGGKGKGTSFQMNYSCSFSFIAPLSPKSLSSLLSLPSLLLSTTTTITTSSTSSPGPAVMRGPIASRVITQLVSATEWGNLDYLIVDMPPGECTCRTLDMPYVHMSQMFVIECLMCAYSVEILHLYQFLLFCLHTYTHLAHTRARKHTHTHIRHWGCPNHPRSVPYLHRGHHRHHPTRALPSRRY